MFQLDINTIKFIWASSRMETEKQLLIWPLGVLSGLWLILWINLTGRHKGPGFSAKCYSGCICKGVFLDEISSWIGRPSKADCPPKVGWGVTQPVESWNRREEKMRREELSLCLCVKLDHQSSTAPGWDHPRTPSSQASDWSCIPGFLGLQLEEFMILSVLENTFWESLLDSKRI